jgi:hypothetical protein
MEEEIKSKLGLSKLQIARGRGGRGCISEGDAYESDQGLLFIKRNKDKKVIYQ